MDCVFCEIAQKKLKSSIVWENEKYIAFENIDPHAPIHMLVMPKEHIEKSDSMVGKSPGLWDELMAAANEVVMKYKLNETGYKLVLNGAGYNHLEHEHIHVLGGEGWKPNYQP